MKRLLILCLILVGCDNHPKDNEGRVKITDTASREICMNGVVYYYYMDATAYSFTPRFTKDSKVIPCN